MGIRGWLLSYVAYGIYGHGPLPKLKVERARNPIGFSDYVKGQVQEESAQRVFGFQKELLQEKDRLEQADPRMPFAMYADAVNRLIGEFLSNVKAGIKEEDFLAIFGEPYEKGVVPVVVHDCSNSPVGL